MTRRLSFVLILLSITAAPVYAQRSAPVGAVAADASVLDQPFVQETAQEGLDLLYNLQFQAAARRFEAIDQRYPEHPIGPFLKALNTWWRILLDLTDTSHDEAFYASMDEVIRRSDRLLRADADHFDAMFFKGAALGFRGRLRSNRGDWFLSARDGLRAMDYVLGVAERHPENDDYVFGKGIYDYYAAVVPERYPFVKPVMLFFPSGDRERGIQELERTAREGRYIQTEAVYFLLQIHYLFEDDFDKSREYVTWLRRRYPANSFFHTFEGRVYARWGRWSDANRIFADVLDRYRQQKLGYNAAMAEQSLYFLARGRMAFASYDEALAHLEELERLARRDAQHGYFEVMGRLRQGMTLDALGRRDEAVHRYRQVLQMEDQADAHNRARRYLEKPYLG